MKLDNEDEKLGLNLDLETDLESELKLELKQVIEISSNKSTKNVENVAEKDSETVETVAVKIDTAASEGLEVKGNGRSFGSNIGSANSNKLESVNSKKKDKKRSDLSMALRENLLRRKNVKNK